MKLNAMATLAAGLLYFSCFPFSGNCNAQVQDQVFVTALGSGSLYYHPLLLRFDRKLHLIGQVDFTSTGATGWGDGQNFAITPSGRIWIQTGCPLGCLGLLYNSGTLIGTIPQAGTVYALVADKFNNAFVVSTQSGGQTGPFRKVNIHGQIVFTNSTSTAGFAQGYPYNRLAITPDGTVWLGGHHFVSSAEHPRLVKLNPQNGNILATQELNWGLGSGGTSFVHIAASPLNNVLIESNGLVSAAPNQSAYEFDEMDGANISNSFQWTKGLSNLSCIVDANNKYYMSIGDTLGLVAHQIVRIDPATGVVEQSWELKQSSSTHIPFICLGPTGEEIYAIRQDLISNNPPSYKRQLVKLSLVTGQMSWIDLTPTYLDSSTTTLANGDPSGYVLANCVDPDGDNDGDGYTNKQEILAGYNPFDASSHPGGPKVYISYDKTQGNALVLTYVDPDGILNPGGLDLNTFSLYAYSPIYGGGDIFWDAAGYLTAINFSPDGTKVDLVYGNLQLPAGLGYELTASIFDLSGAYAWDWHFTPQ
ncbi:MAG: hypothetical protein HY286_04655 [Planctomycetes bacterium]|nr:hypothetical protein [Planctomycetota bacterium]